MILCSKVVSSSQRYVFFIPLFIQKICSVLLLLFAVVGSSFSLAFDSLWSTVQAYSEQASTVPESTKHPMVGQVSKVLQPITEEVINAANKSKVGDGLSGINGAFAFASIVFNKALSVTPDLVELISDKSGNTIKISEPLSYGQYASLNADTDKRTLTNSLKTPWLAINATTEDVYIHQGDRPGSLFADGKYRHYRMQTQTSDKLYINSESGTVPFFVEHQYNLPSEIELVKTQDGYYYIANDKLFKYKATKRSGNITIYKLTAVIDYSGGQRSSKSDYAVNKYSLSVWDYDPFDHHLVHYAHYQQKAENLEINHLSNTNHIDSLALENLIDGIRSATQPDHWINYQYLRAKGKKQAERLIFKKPPSTLWQSISHLLKPDEDDVAYILYDKNGAYNQVDADKHSLLLKWSDNVGRELKARLCLPHPSIQCRPVEPDYQYALQNSINSVNMLVSMGNYKSIAVVPSFVSFMASKGQFQYSPVIGFEYTGNGRVKLLVEDNGGERTLSLPGDFQWQIYTRIIIDQPLEDSVQKAFDSGEQSGYKIGKYYFKSYHKRRLLKAIIDQHAFPIEQIHQLQTLSQLTGVEESYLSSNNQTLKAYSQRQALYVLIASLGDLIGEAMLSSLSSKDNILSKADNIVFKNYETNRKALNDRFDYTVDHSHYLQFDSRVAHLTDLLKKDYFYQIQLKNNKDKSSQSLVIGKFTQQGDELLIMSLETSQGDLISIQVPLSIADQEKTTQLHGNFDLKYVLKGMSDEHKDHMHPKVDLHFAPIGLSDKQKMRLALSVNGLMWSDWQAIKESEPNYDHGFKTMSINTVSDYMGYINRVLWNLNFVLDKLPTSDASNDVDSGLKTPSVFSSDEDKKNVYKLIKAMDHCVSQWQGKRRRLEGGGNGKENPSPQKPKGDKNSCVGEEDEEDDIEVQSVQLAQIDINIDRVLATNPISDDRADKRAITESTVQQTRDHPYHICLYCCCVSDIPATCWACLKRAAGPCCMVACVGAAAYMMYLVKTEGDRLKLASEKGKN